MKTAVSIPDDLFHAADRLARRLKVSRSEVYARALREFLAAREDEEVTERLNAVYSREASAVDPLLLRLQVASVGKEDW